MSPHEYALILSAVRQYHRRRRLGHYYEPAELIGVAWMAMERARAPFERVGQGVSWEAYATKRMYDGMKVYLRSSYPAPGHWREEMWAIGRATHRLEQSLLRTPTAREIAAEIGIPFERLHRWRRKHRGDHPVYLDHDMWSHVRIHNREGAAIVRELATDPADALEARSALRTVDRALARLPSREREAFIEYVAFDMDPAEVGRKHCRSRQWVIVNARRVRKEVIAQIREDRSGGSNLAETFKRRQDIGLCVNKPAPASIPAAA